MNKNTLTSFHILCSSVKIILWSFIHSSTRKGEAGMHKEGKGIVRGKSYYRIIVVRVGLYFLDKDRHYFSLWWCHESTMQGWKGWFCYFQQLQELQGCFLNDQRWTLVFFQLYLLSFKMAFSAKSLLSQVISPDPGHYIIWPFTNLLSEAEFFIFQNKRQLLYSKIPPLVESVIKCTSTLDHSIYNGIYICPWNIRLS